MQEFGVAKLPCEPCIKFACTMANNQNVKVRTKAMKMFEHLYRTWGHLTVDLMAEIKLKAVDTQINKLF